MRKSRFIVARIVAILQETAPGAAIARGPGRRID